MNRSRSIFRKTVIGLALVTTFVVMASVFDPDRTRAIGPQQNPTHPTQFDAPPSTDPHEGLQSLGSLEHNNYVIRIYATDGGPRYSLYDSVGGKELGVLMTLEQIRTWYPGLPVPEHFSAPDRPGALMLVDPASRWPK